MTQKCSVEGCEKPTHAQGWCSAHYERNRRHGSPTGGRAYRCVWISRDETGRPSCEHGPAHKHGDKWECAGKQRERNARRVRLFGSRILMPDEEFKQFALALRKERKENHG